jgi:hypothetical protein
MWEGSGTGARCRHWYTSGRGGGWAKREAEAERDADNDGATHGMGRNVEATCGTS